MATTTVEVRLPLKHVEIGARFACKLTCVFVRETNFSIIHGYSVSLRACPEEAH